MTTLAEECNSGMSAEIRRELAGQDERTIAIAAVLSAAYPALRPLVISRLDALATLAREGWRKARRRQDLVRRLQNAAGSVPYQLNDVRRGLRRASGAERLRIALRELDPDVDIDVTAREWSDLAAAQLEVALLEARAHVEQRYGPVRTPTGAPNGFVVLGLGKLGGRELNAGSDVDVIFIHEADESPTGALAPSIRPFDAFTKIAQRLVSTIDEHDDDGFCARVDLRLRPEGSGGPLVNSIAAAISYYETFGRGWERAALLRARPVAGDAAVGTRFLAELAPFVYRRAVDPHVALEMQEMVRRARIELSESPERDLKLGPGGIREAEFFVQSLQLVWGGHEPRVRTPSMLDGLRRLRARGYVTDRESREIVDGYLLLRRVEHRIQLSSGLQTHLLPSDGVERERIARSLGYRSGHDLWVALERARARIAERFASLAPGRIVAESDERVDAMLALLDPELERSGPVETPLPGPTRVGPPSPEPLARDRADGDLLTALRSLARRPDAPLGGRTRERHPQLARGLLNAVLDAADPEQAAALIQSFFDRLAAPSADSYLRALSEDVRALGKLVGLCGASAYLGGLLVGHPELVDRLLFSAPMESTDASRGRRLLEDELAALGAAERSDAEMFVGATRRAKGALELDVGLTDLAGEVDTPLASRTLSVMAEAVVAETTAWALAETAQKRRVVPPVLPETAG